MAESARLRPESDADMLNVYHAKREGHIKGEERARTGSPVHDLCAEITHGRDFSTRPFKVGAAYQVGYEVGFI